MKNIKEMWCLVDSQGPLFKDYLEDLKPDTNVYLIILQDNPNLLITMIKLREQKCNITLVFEQSNKKLWKKYLNKYVEYSLGVIVDNDGVLARLTLSKFDKIIIDNDSLYYDCLNELTSKTILYTDRIPFRPFRGVNLDRERIRQLSGENKIVMSEYASYVFDRHEDTVLNADSTIKVDLFSDKVEAFEADDRSIKTYNILEYLEEKRFRERKVNIHKQLPKTVARKSTTRKHS